MSRLWEDPLYGVVARELYRRCGLVFQGGQAALFRKRVARRARELGYPDVAAYVAALSRDGFGQAEYEHLIDLLTVNETYFFREVEQMEALLDRVWPGWTGVHRPVRVWSAACSTGCEPYTLAILLLERGLVGPGRAPVEILGTDISETVLRQAREGIYGEFALRATPAPIRERYFKREGERYRLDPRVRSMVAFRRDNLVGGGMGGVTGAFHVIFCRNVLIYFDVEAKRKVVGRLASMLRPGGILFVGRSESLFQVPEAPPMVRLDGVTAYQKPLGS